MSVFWSNFVIKFAVLCLLRIWGKMRPLEYISFSAGAKANLQVTIVSQIDWFWEVQVSRELFNKRGPFF